MSRTLGDDARVDEVILLPLLHALAECRLPWWIGRGHDAWLTVIEAKASQRVKPISLASLPCTPPPSPVRADMPPLFSA